MTHEAPPPHPGMGDAKLKMNGAEITLRGLWADRNNRVSLTQVFAFSASASHQGAKSGDRDCGDRCTFGFSIKPHTTHTLQVEFVGPAASKFKLIDVTSC